MAENRITRYPGMYDEDHGKKFYLPYKFETTKAIFELLEEAYGSYGPGFQLEKAGDKYLIHADVSPIPGESAVLAEEWLVEVGNRALELLGREGNVADMLKPTMKSAKKTKDETEED